VLALSKLLFRTPAGSAVIPVGSIKQLGTVDVSTYSQIRIVAGERKGTTSGITIHLTLMEGTEVLLDLDKIDLTSGANISRVYPVPGSKLAIQAIASAGTGAAGTDILIYG
jgi:hypothetical protein